MAASAVKLVFGSSLAQCFPMFSSVWVSAQHPLSPQHATGQEVCITRCSPPLVTPIRGFLYPSFVQNEFFVIWLYRSVGEGGAALYPGLGILLVALCKRMCRCWEDAPDFCSY